MSEMRDILGRKRIEFKNKPWTIKTARMIFEGNCGSVPYDVWQSAGLYVAKHCSDHLAAYARKILKIKPELTLIPGGKGE